jgi:glycosyltransferase involved in cell wall biosynthesis
MRILTFSETKFDMAGEAETLQGGPQIHITNLAAGLLEHPGVSVHIVQGTADESLDGRRVELASSGSGGIFLHYLYMFPSHTSRNALKVASLMADEGVDIVHHHLEPHPIYLLAALYAYLRRRGFVVTNHSPIRAGVPSVPAARNLKMLPRLSGYYKKLGLMGAVYILGDALVWLAGSVLGPEGISRLIIRTCSVQRGLGQPATALCGVSPACCRIFGSKRYKVIGNPVDTAAYEGARVAKAARILRHDLGLDGRKVVFCPLRVDPVKGQHLLLDISKKMQSLAPPDYVFLLFEKNGLQDFPHSYRDVYERFSRYDQSLEKKLLAEAAGHFVRIKPVAHARMPQLYALSDVVVIPSVSESLSMCALEASSCGKPVVAFDVGDNREAITDKETGYLIRPFDIPAFAESVASLLADAETARRLGAQGRRRVKERFDSKVVVSAYMDGIYLPLMARLGRATAADSVAREDIRHPQV